MNIKEFTNRCLPIMTTINRANRSMASIVESFNVDKLSPIQIQTLLVLQHIGSMHMSDLAGQLFVTRPQLTKIIDLFVEKKLVERQLDPENRRSVTVRLSQEGQEYLEKAMSSKDNPISYLLESLDDQEAEKLVEAMNTVYMAFARLLELAANTEKRAEQP